MTPETSSPPRPARIRCLVRNPLLGARRRVTGSALFALASAAAVAEIVGLQFRATRDL